MTPLCAAGETYISTSTKANKCCTAAEVASNTLGCGNIVCNNDQICNANEGCLCGDCRDQVDHCAGGLVCRGNSPSSACCPIDKMWNATTKLCETPVTCPTTQAPEVIDVGSIPFIGCKAIDK